MSPEVVYLAVSGGHVAGLKFCRACATVLLLGDDRSFRDSGQSWLESRVTFKVNRGVAQIRSRFLAIDGGSSELAELV